MPAHAALLGAYEDEISSLVTTRNCQFHVYTMQVSVKVELDVKLFAQTGHCPLINLASSMHSWTKINTEPRTIVYDSMTVS